MKKERALLLVTLGTLFVFMQVSSIPALGEPVWEPSTPLQKPRAGPAVTVGLDGLIYAIGGVDQGYGMGHVTNTVERFDEGTNSWEYVASMNKERNQPGAVTDSQGRIWVVGGVNKTDGVLDSVEVYNQASNSWTLQSSHLKTYRCGLGIAITPDDRIYVFGGRDSNLVPFSSVEVYDPCLGVWRDDLAPPMNEVRVTPAVAMDEQGRIYAIGGGNFVNELKTVERYDPVLNEWEYVADLPEARGGSAAFTLNGEIWVVGGWRSGFTNACYIYTPGTDTWRIGPSMYEALGTAPGGAVGFSGTAYLIGGERSAGWPSDHVAMLLPEPAPLTGRIAYCTPDPYRLWVINADGTSRYIVPLPYEQLPIVANPQWSADGSWLTFSGGAGLHSQIYIVRPDGSGFCRVTNGQGDLVCPSFSPDGLKIAYAQVKGHLYTIDAVCNAPDPCDHGINVSHPLWSPDGRYIVYTDWGFTYRSDIFLYDLTTGEPQQITHHAPDEAFIYATWSPDGMKLAVTVMDWTISRSDIWVMDANGSDPCNLTANWPTSDEGWPSWSPDGQYIVFTSDISGNLDIWYSPVNHFAPVNITNSPEDKYFPAIGVPELVVIEVTIDIKPGSCPNPVNVKSSGVLPIAILGTDDYDVTTIDPTSIRLAGVEPLRSSLEDVATPVSDSNDCNCITDGPDGFLDLTLKFKTQSIVEAVGDVNDGDVRVLTLTGVLFDPMAFETPIEGADCILIRGRHKPINPADINKDGVVNVADFAIFAQNWLQSSIVED